MKPNIASIVPHAVQNLGASLKLRRIDLQYTPGGLIFSFPDT
jgi:hypothetical protein